MHPFRISKANARRLPALGAAVFIALGLLTPQSQAASVGATTPAGAKGTAASAPRSIPVPKSPDAMSNGSRFHISAQDGAEESSPAPAPAPAPASAADIKAGKQSSAAAGDECGDISGVVNATGSALVQQLKALPRITCTYPLFNLTGENAQKAFREAQMVTVANALRDDSATYAGNNSTAIGQLVLFLRAGYYVQENQWASVGAYGPALDTASRGALDAFFAPHSKDVTDANGEIFNEVVTLIDSTQHGRPVRRRREVDARQLYDGHLARPDEPRHAARRVGGRERLQGQERRPRLAGGPQGRPHHPQHLGRLHHAQR